MYAIRYNKGRAKKVRRRVPTLGRACHRCTEAQIGIWAGERKARLVRRAMETACGNRRPHGYVGNVSGETTRTMETVWVKQLRRRKRRRTKYKLYKETKYI